MCGGFFREVPAIRLLISLAILLSGSALAEDLKVGFVYVGPIGDHGWSYQHDQGRLAVEEAFGDKVSTTYVENVAEGPDAERVITKLAADGHGLIFTNAARILHLSHDYFRFAFLSAPWP